MKIISSRHYEQNSHGASINGINIVLNKNFLNTFFAWFKLLFWRMMKKFVFPLMLALFFTSVQTQAQYESIVQEGEFGISAGAAHYFGDINNKARFNRPKPAVGLFFRKQFSNYIALRVAAHFAQLGYSDVYNTNEFERRRNLSFNTNIWELSLQGDFNFFDFVPSDPYRSFTPYVTIGAGIFS